MDDDNTGLDHTVMNTKDEITYRDPSSFGKEMFLSLRVESPEDSVFGKEQKAATKAGTLSPVLLSPGSTTKKLIASGKIKNCFILLQKTPLDDTCMKATPGMREHSLLDENCTEHTKDAPGFLSAEGNVKCYEVAGSEATNSPTCELEGVQPKACDRLAASRNIFASFLREWHDVKIQENTTLEKPQIDRSLSRAVGDDTYPESITACRDVACQSVTDTNTDKQVTDFEPFLGDDVMSVSSTGSSETIQYPICSEDDSREGFEIITDDQFGGDDDQEAHPERDEQDVFENCDEPPCLESLEYLPVPRNCLDQPPVLSPPLLMRFNDDNQCEHRERTDGLFFTAFRSAKTLPNAPPIGDSDTGHQGSPIVGVQTELPKKSSAGATEINKINQPIIRSESESGKDDSHYTKEELSNSSTSSKVQTGMNKDKPHTNWTEYEQSEQTQNDPKRAMDHVFLHHHHSSSTSSTDTAFSSEKAPPTDRQDLENASTSPQEQCVETEYQEILYQIAHTSTYFKESDGTTNDEALHSCDINLCDSAKALQISEVVSLVKSFPATAREVHKESMQNADVTVDTVHCKIATKETMDSASSGLDQSSVAYNFSQCTDYSVTASVHSSLSDINAETEIERAVASISESQQPAASRAVHNPESIFDGRIEVAEIVIDPSGDSSFPTDEVGIMFSLKPSTHEERGKLPSQCEILRDKSLNVQSDTDQGTDAQGPSISQGSLAVPTHQEGQGTCAHKPSPEPDFEQNFNNCQVLPIIEETTTGQRVTATESQLANSDGQTETAPSAEEGENIKGNSDSFVSKQHTRGPHIPVSDVSGSYTVPDASSRDILQPVHQETSQCKKLSEEKQNKSRCVPNGDSGDTEIKSAESTQPGPPSLAETQPTNLIQSSTTDTNNFGKGADCTVFSPSRSEEMDTAISLALMAQMTARSKAKEQSSNQTTGVNVSSASADYQDSHKPGDVETRHQSASRASDSGCEGDLDTNSYAPQKPKSAHCITTSVGQSSVVETPHHDNLQTSDRRRRTRARYSSGFAIVDYSSPTPPNPGKFDELKMRLMQEHRLHPELSQEGNISHQNLTDWPVATAQQNDALGTKGRHGAVNMQTGVPIEFPNGKRFIAYNKEALSYPASNLLANQAIGQTAAQSQYRRALNRNSNDSFEFGSVATTPSQLPQQNAPQNVQLPQPNANITIPAHNTHQQQIHTHLNPSFIIPPQTVRHMQAPPSNESCLSGVNSAYQQQSQTAGIHQSPISLNPCVHAMPAQSKTYPPGQRIQANRAESGLGISLYQGSVRSSHGVSGVNGAQSRQSTPHSPVVMDEKSSGRGQAPRLALADNFPRSPHDLGASGQPRSDGRETALNTQQTSSVNRRTSDYSNALYEAQQRLFIMARGSAAPPIPHNRGWSGHEFRKGTSAFFGQSRVGLHEPIHRDIQHQRTATSDSTTRLFENENLAANVAPIQLQQRDPVMGGQSARPGLSASGYIGDQADTTRRQTMNSSMHSDGRQLFNLQRNHVAAERHETVTSSTTDNANHITREHCRESIEDPNQMHLANTQPVASLPRCTSQDFASGMNILASEPLSCKEQSLLNYLPKELASYLLRQRAQGISIDEEMKAIVVSLLEEEKIGETKKARPREEGHPVERVWKSTIHHPPTDAPQQNYAASSMTSQTSTGPTIVQRQNEASDTAFTTSLPRANLKTTPQHCQMVDLTEMTKATNCQQNLSLDSEARQRLRETFKNETQKCLQLKTIKCFYNPPPPCSPLLEADVVAQSIKLHESESIQDQIDVIDAPENDSAIDLRTQISQHVSNEGNPMYSQYSLSNSNLYHRAYTAGEPGPIRASSFVNLASQAILPPATFYHNLTKTQLLIRNRLLERRLRIQSRSISTPDILHGYGYPAKKNQKMTMEISEQPDENVPPLNSSISQCHIGSDISHEFNDRNPSLHSPPSASKAVKSTDGATQDPHHCEDAVQNQAVNDNRESSLQPNTSVHYPKMKASLQNRWVTESVQPSEASSIDPLKKRLQTSEAIVTDNPETVREVILVHSAREESHPSNSTDCTEAHSVDQATRSEMGNAPDHEIAKVPTLQNENVLDSTNQPGPGNLEKPGRPKTSTPSRKRKADKPFSLLTCPFCSFQSCYQADIRSHVNRVHFEKHSIKVNRGASRRAKGSKSEFGKAGPKTTSPDVALPVPSSSVATKNHDRNVAIDTRQIHNGETTAVSTSSVPRTNGLVLHSKGSNDVPSHTQTTLAHTGTSNNILVMYSPVFLQQMTPAHQTGEMRPTESAALASQPATTGNNTANLSLGTEERVQAGEFHYCPHCKLPCKNASDLLIHIKFQHTNTKGLNMCFNCGYTAPSKFALRKHILKWHTPGNAADERFKCTQAKCDKSFPTEEKLQRHVRSHTAERNFVCELCDARYRNLTGLRYHRLRHKSDLPHQCQQCGLKFKSVGMLHRHQFQKKHVSS